MFSKLKQILNRRSVSSAVHIGAVLGQHLESTSFLASPLQSTSGSFEKVPPQLLVNSIGYLPSPASISVTWNLLKMLVLTVFSDTLHQCICTFAGFSDLVYIVAWPRVQFSDSCVIHGCSFLLFFSLHDMLSFVTRTLSRTSTETYSDRRKTPLPASRKLHNAFSLES